jgi:filamentous hemagglutinin
MQSAGSGARAIVYVNPTGEGVGHVFNVVNQKGTIRFLDGQTGRPFDWSAEFRDVRLLRTK